MTKIAKCKACGKEIVFIETPNGKKMPVDAKETLVFADKIGWIKAQISHFVTCPSADRFRRK